MRPVRCSKTHVGHLLRRDCFPFFFGRGTKNEAYRDAKRIFSGIQPSGTMHLGNYLGAITNWVTMQHESEADILYSIVDLHSITLPQEPDVLRQSIQDMTISLLACGVDPMRSIIFQQSESKSSQIRDKSCLGLYSYPVLMAADILLYRASHVPIGEDQIQHLELARELARLFNMTYGNFFTPPQHILGKFNRVMSLRDPTKKMSKSDPSHFTRIELTDTSDMIHSKIKKSVTDSDPYVGYDPENRPGVSNLIDIYSALSGRTPEEICIEYRNVERFKAVFKDDLTGILVETLGPIREEIQRLQNDPGYINNILSSGVEKARELASNTLCRVKELVGFR